MMTENLCTYGGKREEILVAYLYGEIPVEGRQAFDRHLMTCAPCRAELAAFGGVRSELASWAPPEPAGRVAFEIPLPPGERQTSVSARMRQLPAWAQVAAAAVFLGVAAGLANLEVTYTSDGLSARTGWMHSASAEEPRALAAPAASTPTPVSGTPWQNDLAALEAQLRAAMHDQASTAASVPSASRDEAVLRRVRQLIQDSERRQQSELALRLAEVARERQADLVKIDRTLGVFQSRTGMEVMRTQRQVNSLAQQVSQRP